MNLVIISPFFGHGIKLVQGGPHLWFPYSPTQPRREREPSPTEAESLGQDRAPSRSLCLNSVTEAVKSELKTQLCHPLAVRLQACWLNSQSLHFVKSEQSYCWRKKKMCNLKIRNYVLVRNYVLGLPWWLRLCGSNAGAKVQFLVRELRSPMPQSIARKKKNFFF